MEKEENYSASLSGNFTPLDHHHNYTHLHHHNHGMMMMMKPQIGETSHHEMMVDYNNNNMVLHHHHDPSSGGGISSVDKLSFADVMQFADFGPKLCLINSKTNSSEEETTTGVAGATGIDDDPVYFLKFPVLNQDDHDHHHQKELLDDDDDDDNVIIRGGDGDDNPFNGIAATSSVVQQLRIIGQNLEKNTNVNPQLATTGNEINNNNNSKNKRKRPRTVKTTEEVESQRMTHIAVERNRRKQMNEHLRVLRSLMPGSYVQRGDQASIIGGAIEFVRELEQLLQCLESQKRRRLYGGDGGGSRPVVPPPPEDSSNNNNNSSSSIQNIQQQQSAVPFLGQVLIPNELETGAGLQLREETAESKSCLADIEVKLLGFDAMIKILSRRRPGQLIKTIAALEDLQLNILHTNVTTIEQTVLYSFNVKVGGEAGRVTAEDIANSVQQIFSFIHADTTTY